MSVYKLSDKVKRKRFKKWIGLLLQMAVISGVYIWAFFVPEETLIKGLIAFALVTLIEQVKGL